MSPVDHDDTGWVPGRRATLFWLLLALAGLGIYAFGLGGEYVPSNGDEMVYAHIARKTGESGHWLPLQSDLPDTRNTKPPLLFWQAMVSGAGTVGWSLEAMRAPSLVYLLLVCAGMVAGLRALTGRWQEGWTALCLLLAFQSSFRFVRPYLTSAPETFWYSLPLLSLFWQRARDPLARPSGLTSLLLGLGLGLGLLYKSYALLLPAAGAWWLALIASDAQWNRRTVLRHTAWLALAGVLALGLFALWPLLDPDPQGVWREFIVGENAGKFEDRGGWWHEAFTLNGSSVWSQLLAYPVNAGLLFSVMLGLLVMGLPAMARWRSWRNAPPTTRLLVAWALVWALAFLLPSQRSARYVIPAMPALAMLLALYGQRLRRGWFLPALLASAALLVLLARVAWVAHGLGLSGSGPALALLIGLCLSAGLCGLGLARPAWTRAATVAAALGVFGTYNLVVVPLDGPVGRYPVDAMHGVPEGVIAVPNGFNGQFERFQFLLPGGHRFEPYETGGRALSRRAPGAPVPSPAEELDALLKTHAAVVWVQQRADTPHPPCLPDCTVLAQRWIMTSRHLPGEVRLDNVWEPQDWLFRREWLLRDSTLPAQPHASHSASPGSTQTSQRLPVGQRHSA